MSDAKKAAIAEAKFEAQVAQAGLNIVEGTNHSHTVWGELDGTHRLVATHSALNGKDTFDFTVEGGHDFNLTIAAFNPLFWNAIPPTQSLLLTDPIHDLLELRFDASTGVTNQTQAFAAERVQTIGHDVVFSIHTATVNGTITFEGLADHVPANETANFSWINIIPPLHAV
jgi:hypothetical protein